MKTCENIYPNINLYNWFQEYKNPITPDDLIPFGAGNVGTVFKVDLAKLIPTVKDLLPWYIVKKQPLSGSSNLEKDILRDLSNAMISGEAPALFSFLYTDYVLENDSYFVLQPGGPDLETIVSNFQGPGGYGFEEWWACLVYQIAKAIEYLETQKINHNDLNFENILFGAPPKDSDPTDFAIMIIDFGSANKGHLARQGPSGRIPPFVLGRDLNYFLYLLVNSGVCDPTFARKMAQFIKFEKGNKFPKETEFNYGLRLANLTEHYWQTSGKAISQWLVDNYNVSELTNASQDCKIGAIIGDLVGDNLRISNHPQKEIIMQNVGAFGPAQTTLLELPNTSLELLERLDHAIYGRNWKTAWPIVFQNYRKGRQGIIDATIKHLTDPTRSVYSDPTLRWSGVFINVIIYDLLLNESFTNSVNRAITIIKPFVGSDFITGLETLKPTRLASEYSTFRLRVLQALIHSIKTTSNYTQAVTNSIQMSADSGVVTGAVAGLLYHRDTIPKEWFGLAKKFYSIDLN